MSRFVTFLVILLILVSVGGIALLASWELPTPSKTVEKVIPDERFPR